MIQNKRVLITGGGGFVGTQLAERLARDNTVTALDLNFDGNSFALSGLQENKGIETAKIDIMDEKGLMGAVSKAQIVVHTAAVLGVQKVLQAAIQTLDVNYRGTSNVLKAAYQSGNCERFIQFSTSEIYGANAFETDENGDTILTSVQNPRWCYSISKLAAEHLALGYYREKGLPIVIIRPFNVFGPGRVGSYAVLKFILKALKNETLEIYGDGSQIRAWCYIDDFCQGVLKSMESTEAVGQAFNIGNPRNTMSNYSLAKKIVQICGSRSKIVFKPIDFKDIDVRVPDISKAKKILGYDPKVEIEEGLSATIEWVKKNYEWFRKQ
ncbi:MAG: NAD-dependent epimerase/dehydratase family protein [Chloroflexi bacterium]|nr:NAD-dependent epimerase/dehydratase family protein [Chloroflexota bacterium]